MSNEKMREEFEAACKQHAIDAGFPDYDYGFERSSEDPSCYADSHTQAAWWAWRSSRAAVVVELPPSPYLPGSDPADMTSYEVGEAQGRCDMWAAFRECLEFAGLKVKP